MVGMFKQLDSWVKGVLPVLPYSSLQDSVLHLLQVNLFIVFTVLRIRDVYPGYRIRIFPSRIHEKDYWIQIRIKEFT
jgi:hypothetical protein